LQALAGLYYFNEVKTIIFTKMRTGRFDEQFAFSETEMDNISKMQIANTRGAI